MFHVSLRCGPWAANVSPLGAEVTSLRHDQIGELIWQADTDSWRRQSPLLFPIIGRYPEGIVRFGERPMALPPHGFAPARHFRVVTQTEASCRMVLADDAETRAVYPFAFSLAVDFELDASGLDMRIALHNPSHDVTLPLMLGLHPGFAWPLPGAGPARAHRLTFSAPEHSPMVRLGDRLPADDGVFHFDGRSADPSQMDFRGLTHAISPVRSNAVTFGTDVVNVALAFEGFANLAIWRRDTAPFLCLEPWTNLPIAVGEPTQFADLPDIERLAPGERRDFAMRIAPGGTGLDAALQN